MRAPANPSAIWRLSWPFIGLVAALGVCGLAMMISAGGGHVREYALPQAVRFALGFALMLGIAVSPMQWLYRYAYALYALGLLALIGVDALGHMGMGAKRWISLGGLNLQPSEFMKLAVILALARYYHALRLEDIRRFRALIPPVIMLAAPAALILSEPNLGTAVITLLVGAFAMFLAGVRRRYFLGAGAAAAAAAPVAWHFLHDYQKQRVLTFLNPQADPLGAGYNILQSMIAVGSGGPFGKGFLHGTQSQLNFLPEKHTDFIFTLLAEEWGFAGGVFLLALYALLLLFSLRTAAISRSGFGALVAASVGVLIFIHVMINVAMVMGLIPVVGVPLPFLSYGGSIMLSTLAAMGLLLNADLNRDRQISTGRGI